MDALLAIKAGRIVTRGVILSWSPTAPCSTIAASEFTEEFRNFVFLLECILLIR